MTVRYKQYVYLYCIIPRGQFKFKLDCIDSKAHVRSEKRIDLMIALDDFFFTATFFSSSIAR